MRIVLTFAGLPTGITLLAPQQITGTGGAPVGSTGLATSGPITLGLLLPDGTLGASTTTYSGFSPSSGAATITYEVVSTGASSPTTVDTLSIPVYYTAPAGTVIPSGSTGTVQASIGGVSGSPSFSTLPTSGVTLRFAANAGVPAIPLQTGTATPCGGPAFGLSAASLNFGNQAVSVPSSPRPVTLTNTGLTTLTLTTVAAGGDFSKTDNCAGASVAPGNTCTINVTFTPTVPGPRTGSVSVADNASGSPQQIRLFGTGISGAVAALGLSKVELNFGAVATSTTSGSQAVTLTNSGGASLTLTSVIASGDFGQTNDCGGSLAASTTCTITVTFSPVAIGRRDGAITIVDSASGSPHIVRLVGLGTSGTAPGIGFSSTSLDFGGQTASTTSAAKLVTVTNTGTASLIITAVTGTGDFGVSGAACVTTLAPGGTCVVSVTFTPTTTGIRRGSVAITDNATGSPQVIRLFGNGT